MDVFIFKNENEEHDHLGTFFFYEKQQCYILNKDLKGTKEGWEILLKQRTKQMEPPKY